ncbi:MAG TPA: ATP synthase F0 subunit B [Thermoanaerobaculia bacterium]|nr:ATP synthase F0 subunit B [Thermoanaerobaculia bacterium]
MQINLTPDPSLLAIMVIFIANYLIVRRYFLKPINEVLEAREAETRAADELHEQALARFNAATAEMEEQLHIAKREASSVRDRFREDAATHRTGVIERAADEAKQIGVAAESRLAKDVAEARAKIVGESSALALLAAERILGRPL